MIKENGTILIPIDFSKQSLIAIKDSYNLAKFTKSKLHLLHVYHKNEEENKKGLEDLVASTAAESGLICESSSAKGDVYVTTDKVAEKINANLIVVGLDAHVRIRSFLSSSAASKFIKNAPCPVITIRSTAYVSGCKNICVPLDTSAESREKIPYVIQIAKYFGAGVRIVCIFDPNNSEYENEMLPYLQQIKKYIKDRGVSCTNKSIPSKTVAEAIVEYANKNECDLIVQMNKTDLNLGEMFGGTMSQKIVDISNIPVLTINPMKRASISSAVH